MHNLIDDYIVHSLESAAEEEEELGYKRRIDTLSIGNQATISNVQYPMSTPGACLSALDYYMSGGGSDYYFMLLLGSDFLFSLLQFYR